MMVGESWPFLATERGRSKMASLVASHSFCSEGFCVLLQLAFIPTCFRLFNQFRFDLPC